MRSAAEHAAYMKESRRRQRDGELRAVEDMNLHDLSNTVQLHLTPQSSLRPDRTLTLPKMRGRKGGTA